MANKKRRNKKLRRQQVALRQGDAAPDVDTASAPSVPAMSMNVESATATPAAPTAQRQVPAYAQGIRGPRRGGAAVATTATTIDIDARVPYFASDLRRIAITAALLVAVIVAASFFIR